MKALLFLNLLLGLLFSSNLLAREDLPIFKEEQIIESSGPEQKKWEFAEGLQHSVEIIETDPDTGIDQAVFDTRDDDHRYTLAFYFNANPLKVTDLLGGEFTYGYKFKGGEHFELFMSSHLINLTSLSDLIGSASSKGLFMSGGFGFGLRGHLIQYFIDSKYIFETLSGYFTYNLLSSSELDGKYTGPGIKASYGIHQRVGKTVHYGLKVAYDVASVRRPALTATETTGERALILKALSLGLELTLYY